MKRVVSLLLVIGLAIFSSSALAADAKVFKVYTDANSPDPALYQDCRGRYNRRPTPAFPVRRAAAIRPA